MTFFTPTLFKIIITLIILFASLAGPVLYNQNISFEPDGDIDTSEINVGVKALNYFSTAFFWPIRTVNSFLPASIQGKSVEEYAQGPSLATHMYFAFFFLVPFIAQAYLLSCLAALGVGKIEARNQKA